MIDYCDSWWKSVFSHNGLHDFGDYWNCPGTSVERANFARQGWSGVTRSELALPSGEKMAVFVKRQRDYKTRTLRHPISGVPTLAREFKNLTCLIRRGVGTAKPLYFANRIVGQESRCILVTEELSGFRPLAPTGNPRLDFAAAAETGRLLRAIHAAGISHNCYYPKHVFLRRTDDDRIGQACVIDLEKGRARFLGCLRPLHDLHTMLRRCGWWTRGNRIRFVTGYFGNLNSTLAKVAMAAALQA
jgi:hypothetical protein